MIRISQEEYDKLEKVREEYNRLGYMFSLVKFSKIVYATVSKYRDYEITLSRCGHIHEDFVLEQSEEDFMNQHTDIHLNPELAIELWRRPK